jgi:hypothetical protein
MASATNLNFESICLHLPADELSFSAKRMHALGRIKATSSVDCMTVALHHHLIDSELPTLRRQWEKVEVMTTKRENLRTKMRIRRGLDLQATG